jgi:hypothetical protein
VAPATYGIFPDAVLSYLEADMGIQGEGEYIFNLPPSYAKEMCRMIIHQNLNINWQSILYPGNIDKELIRLMAEAGCRESASILIQHWLKSL